MKNFLLFILTLFVGISTWGQVVNANDKLVALKFINENKVAIGLTENDLNSMEISSTYTVQSTGITMVYLQQTYKSIPVLNKMVVLAFKEGKLISNAGKPIVDIENVMSGLSDLPQVNASTAVKLAFTDQKLQIIVPTPTKISENGHKFEFGKPTGVVDEVTAELYWFPIETETDTIIKLGWQVQVGPEKTDDLWHIRIDAKTGEIFEKINATIFEDLTSKHLNNNYKKNLNIPEHNFVNNATSHNSNLISPFPRTNLVGTANYLVIPYPSEAPNFAPPEIRTNPWSNAPGNATSLGWHNNGNSDFTYSRGNNVWATEDTLGVNQNTGLPATSTTSPDPLNFNFTPNFYIEPSKNLIMQQFAITNLFYWNNITHDITYQYGFDEISGNFQENNQGRGGVGNDRVMALAQSGNAGHIGNNANFTVGADGGTARMRMYLFNPAPPYFSNVLDSNVQVRVNTPGSIAGNYLASESRFSVNNKLIVSGPVTGQVVYYNDDAGGTTHEACSGAPANSLAGKIAMIDRGNCSFVIKVARAQSAGAIGVIMVNNVAGYVAMGGDSNFITIPAIAISQADGAILAAQLVNGLNVTLRPNPVLDGDLDNGIIVHEYAHGISNRLTGGPTNSGCLSNAERGGEGWSDYFGLMLTTNWASANVSSGNIPRTVGTYVNGESTAGAGIRNYPYTTNMAANPLTYAHMGITGAPWLFSDGSEVHNYGEIWCAALWEMTWGIIQQENNINPNLYNFSLAGTGGNSIALKLVMEGMRLQPCGPGYIDARNAILTADVNLYGGRHQCAIWTAFAKRGMGYSALQGSSNNLTDQTAAFDLPPAPSISTQPTDLSVLPGANAVFTVVSPAPINGAYKFYNWQVSTNGGTIWNDVVPAVTTSTLTLNSVTVSMNGYKYRCIITQGCNTTTSSVATLTVAVPSGFTFSSPAPTIAPCPAPATMDVILGTNAVGGFTNPITVSSSAPPAGTTVSFIPSNTVTPGNNVTVRLTGTNTLIPGSYTITITGTATGATTQTRDITYTISASAGPVISVQPSNQTTCAGNNATFSITSGTATSFQWQFSTNGGASFNNVTNGGVYAGATTATLNISGTTAGMNSYQYRCVATTLCGSTTSSVGILTVNTPPAISSQPTSASVCTGSNQTLTVVATGSSLSYQWYISTDGGSIFNILSNGGIYSGATTAGLTITGVTSGINNYQYRCEISGICPVTPITSNAATITVATSLSITGQPAAVVICEGNNTNFTVSAVGASNYQWQVSTNGGSSYSNVVNGGVYSGASSATLNITSATVSLTGNLYRCELSSNCGAATSNAALLTINSLPTITTQPNSITLCAGSNNTFSVVATGTGITYQWQISTAGCTGPWTNIGGANLSSYTLSGITTGMDNTGYRCIVTGTCTPAVTSNCALLNVVSSVTITNQPQNLTICSGDNSSFSVAGSGSGIIYQWQVNTGSGFLNISNGGIYSGATSSTLSITGGTTALNGYQYRCQLSNATCSTPGVSNAATLTVNSLPSISTNPVNQNICLNGNTSFGVAASGTNISYQWQVNSGGGFVNISNGGVYAGALSNSLTITGVTIAMNNYQYRCIVNGTCSPVANSNTATLTVYAPVILSTSPANVQACSGSAAVFSVIGTSVPTILYQWQLSSNGGSTWTNLTGANAATYTTGNVSIGMNNNQYRCLLSSATCSTPITSGAGILTVHQLPTVGLSASPLTSLMPGQSTTLSATPTSSTGGTLSVNWLLNSNPISISGNTLPVGIANLGAYQVRIQETWPGNFVCFNNSQVVTIDALVSSKLFIFPSPNDGNFTVTYYNLGGNNTERQIMIYDSKGAMVFNRKFPISGSYTLIPVNLESSSSGIYHVVVGDINGNKLAEGKVHVTR